MNPQPSVPARVAGRRKIAALILVSSILAGAVFLLALGGRDSDLTLARRAIERGRWSTAREHLQKHLAKSPDDVDAHLLMAEALARGAQHDANDIRRALRHLQQIGDDSASAEIARVQEAKLTLLELRRPASAETLLHRALELAPNSLEANLLMWKLYDLTERHGQARPYFWRVYELTPRDGQLARLREWFLSEFFVDASCRELDLAMGIPQRPGFPANVSRLLVFREAEPDAAFVHAGIASHFRQAGEQEFALKMLNMAPDVSLAVRDANFVAVLFHTLLDLGEFEKAETSFKQWPPPHRGYDYWRSAGLFEELIRKDYAAAAEFYRRALGTWLGKLDWKMKRRAAECLRRTGRTARANQLLEESMRFSKRFHEERLKSLRKDLARLDDPEVLKRVEEFYRMIGLKREAKAWGDHRKRRLKISSG